MVFTNNVMIFVKIIPFTRKTSSRSYLQLHTSNVCINQSSFRIAFKSLRSFKSFTPSTVVIEIDWMKRV